MLMLLAACLVIGRLAGGSGTDSHKTMALTTALRNVGVGRVIVTGNFAGIRCFSHGIVKVFGSLLVALCWRQRDMMARPPGRR